MKCPVPRLIGLGCLVLILLQGSSVNAFDSFEHRYLGNTTYDIVSKLLNIEKEPEPWTNIPIPGAVEADHRDLEHQMAFNFLKKANVPVGFGDLPALAGDYTESVKDLRVKFDGFRGVRSEEVKWILAIRRQWFNACRWHHEHISKTNQKDKLNLCFGEFTTLEQLVPDDAELASTGYQPTRMEQSEFERLPGFAGLATSNKTHFPQHSWFMYIQHHYCALVFAAASDHGSIPVDEQCNSIRDSESAEGVAQSELLFYQAIIFEGFAHHFLHDSFSSGHIGIPYGGCLDKYLYFSFLSALGCRPTKQLLQHTHDTLNRIGIKVVIPKPPESVEKDLQGDFLAAYRKRLEAGWTAFGDDHLLIPEASFHRAVLLRVAVESLMEVYCKTNRHARCLDRAMRTGAEPKGAPTFVETCEKWSRLFPIPYEDDEPNKKKDESKFQYSCTKNEPKDLWNWGWSGRSSDERVSDPALEGWKIMVTYGEAFGKFNQLNADGSVKEVKPSLICTPLSWAMSGPPGGASGLLDSGLIT